MLEKNKKHCDTYKKNPCSCYLLGPTGPTGPIGPTARCNKSSIYIFKW